MLPRILLIASLLGACATAGAQAPAPTAPEPQEQARPEGRKNQKVEFIRHEDNGTIIEEVRYAGQPQSITVQPKSGMPEYEIQPADMTRTRPADNRDGMGEATGRRVWNVLKF
ncbi:MAG: hypothetical protein ACAH21_05355 [Ramlibacter sp.]